MMAGKCGSRQQAWWQKAVDSVDKAERANWKWGEALTAKPDLRDVLPPARLHHLNFSTGDQVFKYPRLGARCISYSNHHIGDGSLRRQAWWKFFWALGPLPLPLHFRFLAMRWIACSPPWNTPTRGSKQCEHLILDWNLQKYELITCSSSKLILSVVLIAINSLLIHTVILGEVFRNGHTLTHRYSSPAFYVLCHFAFLSILLFSAQATFWVYCCLFRWCAPNGYSVGQHSILSGTSQMPFWVIEHVSIFLSVICTSFDNCLFKSFAQFYWILFFLMLSFKSSLCILNINSDQVYYL